MKKILYLVTLIFILGSCASSKNYLERSNEEKALSDAVKKLSKSPNDEEALAAVPVLYKSIQQSHLAKITSFKNSRDMARWDKILAEYQVLQSAYETVVNNTAAFKLINPVNFSTEILETKEQAALDNYNLGADYNAKAGRDNAKRAYQFFKKADKYLPGFKDASQRMNQAYENAIVDVIINPVQDNSFFFNSSWGNSGYNYSNEYFQQTLLRELQDGNSNGRYAARFYSEWQARRDQVDPEWVVDLKLRNLDVPYPQNYNYTRSVNNRIQSGTDTSGKPLYQNVYATLRITRSSFVARADMEVNIRDVVNNRTISNKTYRDDYRWQEEYATYSGDSRALSSNDWALVNNRNGMNTPRKEDVLNELYRKIYPQVKNSITYAVDW